METDIKQFENIPSEREMRELADEQYIILLKYIPGEKESKRLEGAHNAHLFFELSFIPTDEELVDFELIPHVVEGVEIHLDHAPTDNELYNMQKMEQLTKDRNLHSHILMHYVVGYEERRKYRKFRNPPNLNFLLTSVPNFEVRGELTKILPPPNVLLLLDRVPTKQEIIECRRIKPNPYIGLLLDHIPNEEEYNLMRDEMSNTNTIVYFNLGRELNKEEIEYMKKSWIPFTTATSREQAILNMLSF